MSQVRSGMTKNEQDLFNLLRKANLDKYFSKMLQQAITVSHLVEFNDDEMKELAIAIEMSLGDKHDLNKILKDYRAVLEANKERLNSDTSSAEIALNPSSTSFREKPNHPTIFKFDDKTNMHIPKGKINTKTR
jgi:hypothetical protein